MDERVIEAYISEVWALICKTDLTSAERHELVKSKMYRLAQAAYSQGRGSGYESGFDAGMAVGLNMSKAEKEK